MKPYKILKLKTRAEHALQKNGQPALWVVGVLYFDAMPWAEKYWEKRLPL